MLAFVIVVGMYVFFSKCFIESLYSLCTAFNAARGHQIERENYLADLLGRW